MCGITGFFEVDSKRNRSELDRNIKGMAKAIIHRGPDKSGHWVDRENGVALGFRRLAILDLSPAGDQPMRSPSGRYVIVFNGEIYNFLDLRDDLQQLGYTFRGESDTEVMLAAIEHWGITEAVSRFNGMFAFALWDSSRRELKLVRDRLGVKPMYYGWQGKTFLFGSELSALRAYPGFEKKINEIAVQSLLKFAYIATPHSIYSQIYKQRPATILTISPSRTGKTVSTETYWSIREVAEAGQVHQFAGTDEEAIEQLEHLLRKSVKERMIADVPLGAFLSGGVDSSTIVAMMQLETNLPIKTFTIGFQNKDYDEAPFARKVAQHLGTDHTELCLDDRDAYSIIPSLANGLDEPYADSSFIPSYLVAQLASRSVTVALSGDGGDELFFGYNRYLYTERAWRAAQIVPRPARKFLSRGLIELASFWNKVEEHEAFIPAGLRFPQQVEKLQKLSRVIGAENLEDAYTRLVSFWNDAENVFLGNGQPDGRSIEQSEFTANLDPVSQMSLIDMQTYMMDDILTKVDRATMAVSLEGRVPFLDDHRIVEFAWSLPNRMKIRKGESKWILRRLLAKYMPLKSFDRPKMGFAIPLDEWLRGPLKQWANDLLDPALMRKQGFLNPGPVQRVWQEHLKGNGAYQSQIWIILMFQAWLLAQD